MVAAGVAGGRLLRRFGAQLPLYPVKGYSASVAIREPTFAPIASVMDEAYKVAIVRLGLGALIERPREQAEVVRMSFFSDQPHSEIAAALNLPLGTVKSRLRLAMGRLRDLLGDLA